jgi:hypothetical protein
LNYKHTILFFLFFIHFGQNTYAQNRDNRKRVQIIVTGDKYILPNKYILKSTLVLRHQDSIVQQSLYEVRLDTLVFSVEFIRKHLGQPINLSYRYIDLPYLKSYAFIDSAVLKQKATAIQIAYDLSPEEIAAKSNIIDNKNLEYNGSFSRGFSVGNAQSLVLNSKFDMQLEGEIGNGIKINAAISDDNIPIQPEGNTQVLQEFDKVFIKLSKDKTSVVAGDYSISSHDSYFMKYLKKLKGLGATTEITNKSNSILVESNVATSRGKFARQTIDHKEGNQGPYRLTGINNERFIIILSGTEKIYFNGTLLKRGQEYDYVIDYNLAQITFTPNRLVARESRIIVEYEYTDQNYYRTLYSVGTKISHRSTNLAINFYSEQDSKNSQGQQSLDSNSIKFLQNSGDQTGAYSIPSIRVASKDENANIRYELLNNPNFSIDKIEFYLKYSLDPIKGIYTSNFTEVGQGKGSYSIDPTLSLNGRVYKFVGANNGSYEPVIQLVPPEKKQMMNISLDQKIGKHTNVYSDFSITNYDKNRFSEINDNDNVGLASYTHIIGTKPLHVRKDSLNNDTLNLVYQVSYEGTGQNFKPLNQYRSAEFTRDWNYIPTAAHIENIFKSSFGIKNNSNLSLLGGYNRYDVKNTFQGNNINVNIHFAQKGFLFDAQPSLTKTSSNILNTNFIRPNFNSMLQKSLTQLLIHFII